MQSADFGVTTVPSHLVDKSGGVAAMISHNLPVIGTNYSQHDHKLYYNSFHNKHCILMDRHFQDRINIRTKSIIPVDMLALTTKQFIADLF